MVIFNNAVLAKEGNTFQPACFEDLDFVGIYFQSGCACHLLQIQSHLVNLVDSVKKQAAVINVISSVFEER